MKTTIRIKPFAVTMAVFAVVAKVSVDIADSSVSVIVDLLNANQEKVSSGSALLLSDEYRKWGHDDSYLLRKVFEKLKLESEDGSVENAGVFEVPNSDTDQQAVIDALKERVAELEAQIATGPDGETDPLNNNPE